MPVMPLLQGRADECAQFMISPPSLFSLAPKAFHTPSELPVPRASTVSCT